MQSDERFHPRSVPAEDASYARRTDAKRPSREHILHPNRRLHLEVLIQQRRSDSRHADLTEQHTACERKPGCRPVEPDTQGRVVHSFTVPILQGTDV